VQIPPLELTVKKTAKQSAVRNPPVKIFAFSPETPSAQPSLIEAEAMIPSFLRTSIDEHLPYRRIIE
jgi:hypothetical protein